MKYLFKITTAKGDVFFVVANGPSEAADVVSKQWKKWDYVGKADAIKIEMLAAATQYPPETGAITRLPWLLEDKP